MGYKRNSPDVNKKVNVVPSGDITMKGVDFKVRGHQCNAILRAFEYFSL